LYVKAACELLVKTLTVATFSMMNLGQKCAKLSGLTSPFKQFHQHFLRKFCINILLTNNYKAKLYLDKSWAKAVSYKKRKYKMLMKLTPVVNFINIVLLIFFFKKIQSQTVIREKLYKKIISLMKLTP